MKKILFVFFVLFGEAIFCKAFGQGNDVTMQIIKEGPAYSGNPKTSNAPLIITQNDNVLTLPATPVDYTLQLRDANGIVVYSAYIPVGSTLIILPTYFSGGFEIRLVTDTYYYIGYIVL